MKTQNPFQWQNYLQHPTEVRVQMLIQLESMLPNLTWRQQAEQFEGAPYQVTLYFLKKLELEAQKKVYQDYLPAIARKQAWSLLHRRVKEKLDRPTTTLALS